MNKNEELINRFYTAFQQKDYNTMQNCYAENAQFNDAVFKNLSAHQVKSMWEMLLKKSTDLHVDFKNIQADEFTGSSDWIATYTFSATHNKVVNKVHANFEFAGGKIVKHTDHFDFYKWASQAFGFKGRLLGWTDFMKRKVQETAAKNLENFMKNKEEK
ncbi:MAG: nuclear transport factor 2 family protein [Daejeonella sp.]